MNPRTIHSLQARHRTNGVSLAELLIAFVLVLLLLLYTISSFVASNNYLKRGKEYSTALFLGQTKMEELQVTPISDITPESNPFEPPFEEYEYHVSLEPWEGELQQLEVRVVSPRGAAATIRTLRQSQAFQGIIADPATNTVAFTRPNSSLLHFWNENAPAPASDGSAHSQSKPLADGNPGALAGHPGSNFMWAVNLTTNTITPYRESEADPWAAGIPFPAVDGLGPSRLAGIAMDEMGNQVFCADWSNRGIWIYNDGIPGLPTDFQGRRPHAPVSPPLGIPSGVATDQTGSLVVVADTENQCLRKLFVNLAAPTLRPPDYAPDQLEEAQGVGYWLKDRLRHPKGMGAPQGVAVSATGWAIHTIDRAYLYTLTENSPTDTKWDRVELEPELAKSSPSGLAFDEFNNLLFITTKNGELWKYEIDNGKFSKLVGASHA